jgi:hypothetical protein
MGTVIGAILLVIVGVAALFLLPTLWLLYVGRYRRVAIGNLIVVGVALLAAFRGQAAVWPLPAFLAVAAIFAWQERTTETE